MAQLASRPPVTEDNFRLRAAIGRDIEITVAVPDEIVGVANASAENRYRRARSIRIVGTGRFRLHIKWVTGETSRIDFQNGRTKQMLRAILPGVIRRAHRSATALIDIKISVRTKCHAVRDMILR